jgi:hypothetical protein
MVCLYQFFILLSLALLHETIAQPCSMCGNNGDEHDIQLVSPHTVALKDGTTCEQLVFEVELYDESDDICASFYQVVGFATCGCSESPNNGTNEAPEFGAMPRQSYCHLCYDGSLPDPNAIFDANTLVTCGKVEDYLQINVAQSEEVCDVIQYQGVVNCGCPYSPIPAPTCSLCKQEGETVLNVHELAESGEKGTTCGAMEYKLAMDREDQINEKTCSALQHHFSSKCNCGKVMRDEFSSVNTTTVASPSESPSILVSNSPTNIATDESSIEPTFVSSSQPTLLPSEASSYLPSVIPSIKGSSQPSIEGSSLPSSSPTKLPSTRPSIVPSSKPTFEGSMPPTLSSSPSYLPSMNPTLTNAPSFSPSSILDRTENCTALENGIFPDVQNKAENLVVKFAFNLWVEYQQELDLSVNYPVLRSKLMDAFGRKISCIAAGCTNSTRRLGALHMDAEEKIFYVEMTEFLEGVDVTCAEADVPVESSATVVCIPILSSYTVYFSSLDSDNGATDLAAANVDAYITNIVQNEFSVLVQSVPGIYNGTIVDEFKGTWFANERSSSGSKVAIGVGVGCSLVALLALGIVVRGRQDTSLETKGMFGEGQIRSDDSISDNPTISSGRRAQMTGWEGSLADESFADDLSSQYSRQIISSKRVSDGMDDKRAIPYQLRESSYLPCSVLRDLLGDDDGDLSIGTRYNDDLSLDPVDMNTIDL